MSWLDDAPDAPPVRKTNSEASWLDEAPDAPPASRAVAEKASSPGFWATVANGLGRMGKDLSQNPMSELYKRAESNPKLDPTGPESIGAVLGMLGKTTQGGTTGFLDALSNMVGKGGLPNEDIQNVKPSREIMENHFSMSPLGAWPASLILDAKLDPANVALGVSEAAPEAAHAVGDVMQKGAKGLYFDSLRKPLADVVEKFRTGRETAENFKKVIWNEGEPLLGGLGKNNADIGEQLNNLRQEAYTPIKDAISKAGGNEKFHLAPGLDNAVQEHLTEQGVASAQVRSAEKALQLRGVEEAKAAELAAAGSDPKKIITAGKRAEKAAKAIEKEHAALAEEELPDSFTWLKQQIRDKDGRDQAIAMLKEHAPDLSGVIDKASISLKNHPDKQNILGFFDNLIGDLGEGPRTLEELQELKKSYANAAAGNVEMAANANARNFRQNQAKTADNFAAQDIGTAIDNFIEQKLGSSAATKADKAKYGALARMSWPVHQKIGVEDGRPIAGLVQGIAGGYGLGQLAHGDWKTPLTLAAAKIGNEVQRQPKYGMLAGRALNQVSKLNIWDQMMRSWLEQRGANAQPANRQPLSDGENL